MSQSKTDILDNSQPKKNNSTERPTQNKLFDLLVCGICLDTFKDPHTLDCGHNYCGECLIAWFDQNKICPSCNWPATRPPIPNHTLNNIISQCTDQSNEKRLAKDAWKKIFPVVLQTSHLIDLEDDVARCTVCHWELAADYTCERCEIRYANNDPSENAFQTSDDAVSHSSQDVDLTDFVVSDEHDLEFDESESEHYESGLDNSIPDSRLNYFDSEALEDRGTSSDDEDVEGTSRHSIVISSNDASSNDDDDSDVVVNKSRRNHRKRTGISYSSEEEDPESYRESREGTYDTNEDSSGYGNDSIVLCGSDDNHMMELSDSEFQRHEIAVSDDNASSEADYPDYTELARATDNSSVVDSSNSELDSDTDPDYDFVSPPPPPPKSESSKKRESKKKKKSHKKHKKARSG